MFANSAFSRQEDAFPYHGPIAGDVSGFSAVASLVGDLLERDTPEALRSWLLDHAHRHDFAGARYLHLGHLPAIRHVQPWKLLRFLSTHQDQAGLWFSPGEEGRALVLTFLPFAWSIASDLRLTDAQRDWYAAQQLRDLPAGITVPVQDHPTGPACLILFGGSEARATQLVEKHTPMLAMQALCFHLSARALLPAGAALGGALSDREIACLRLAAMGETLAEAAERLGISVRTVEMHVARASKKLNANNKIHAVAIAIGAGLIRI